VDVGVHQDGLVHVSQLADRYVSDPNQVVRVGQRVRVTVMSIDLARNRIALTMKARAEGASVAKPSQKPAAKPAPNQAPKPAAPAFQPRPGTVAPNGMRFR
jgi:protein Tex